MINLFFFEYVPKNINTRPIKNIQNDAISKLLNVSLKTKILTITAHIIYIMARVGSINDILDLFKDVENQYVEIANIIVMTKNNIISLIFNVLYSDNIFLSFFDIINITIYTKNNKIA